MLDASAPEGVCPHCTRTVGLTPILKQVARHWTYMHPLNPHRSEPPAVTAVCPGTRHWPLLGNPELGQLPYAICPLRDPHAKRPRTEVSGKSA